MDALRASSDGHLRQVDGHLVVEPGRTTASDIGAIYRDLAVLCLENQLRRVLVKPGDDDPLGERALRMALTTMVLAGLPAGFRLALVAGDQRIEARYRFTESDLCLAGVRTKMFKNEESAARWLSE
jgi:hypothetical protein